VNGQNYANHRRYVPMFHIVLFGLILLTIAGSFVNLFESLGDHERLYGASLITVISICLLFFFFFCRIFPARAQDRAIRAEENLRHFVLTGKLLDPRLTIRQVIALRFASDGEFVALARRAAEEQMSQDDIKRAVTAWRPDYHRA